MSANEKPDGLEAELARRAREIESRVDAINLAAQPAQAGERVMVENDCKPLIRAVREADEAHQKSGGGTNHYVRDCLLPALAANGLRVADNSRPAGSTAPASAVPAWRDSFPPTHYCRECKALWRRWPDGSWSLVTAACGKCCDNVPMGEQIAPLASEYPTLRVERPTALATPGEVAPGAPNQAGVTAGETAPPPPSTPASAEAVARAAALNACELIAGNPVLLTSDAVDAIVDRAVAHALRAQRNGGAA